MFQPILGYLFFWHTLSNYLRRFLSSQKGFKGGLISDRENLLAQGSEGRQVEGRKDIVVVIQGEIENEVRNPVREPTLYPQRLVDSLKLRRHIRELL